MKGKLIFPAGEYEGEILDGKPHGKGKLTYNGFDVYEGDWENSEQTGKGKYIWSDSDSNPKRRHLQEGDIIKGRFNGKGKIIFVSGDIYEGDIVDEDPHGKGKMTYADGRVEEGNWEDGEYIGK